jgi:hypothetical protein
LGMSAAVLVTMTPDSYAVAPVVMRLPERELQLLHRRVRHRRRALPVRAGLQRPGVPGRRRGFVGERLRTEHAGGRGAGGRKRDRRRRQLGCLREHGGRSPDDCGSGSCRPRPQRSRRMPSSSASTPTARSRVCRSRDELSPVSACEFRNRFASEGVTRRAQRGSS